MRLHRNMLVWLVIVLLLTVACLAWLSSEGTYEMQIGEKPEPVNRDSLKVDTLPEPVVDPPEMPVPIEEYETEPDSG